MYVTRAERNLAQATAYLRLAQQALASARLVGDQSLVQEAEQHVLRHLTYVGNAQDWVLRQRKRHPGSIFHCLDSIPFMFEVV